MNLSDKLENIRECIREGWDEDAQEHIFDLLRALRLRDKPDFELTADGSKLKALLETSED